MLDVASLLQFDFFSHFRLCAGAGGLYRVISNVVILDYEGIEEDFCDFHKGDFVLTNLLYAREQPEKIYSSFSQLMKIGVSAIAVKSVFFQELPQQVKALADQQQVPLFFFDSIYIEDVILNLTDYLRSDTNYTYYENLIDTFLTSGDSAPVIDKLLQEVKTEEHHYISVMYISYKTAIDEFSIQRCLNGLQLQKHNLRDAADFCFMKYKKGIFFLYFYKEKPGSTAVMQNWKDLLQELLIVQSRFYIGISDQPLLLSRTDIAIQRSFYANTICRQEGAPFKKYSELAMNNLLLPLADNAYVKEYLCGLLAQLRESESGQSAHLVDTLRTYVQCNFHIDQTGKAMFQHPNTIRYRIARIKAILGMENDLEFQMAALLITRILLREDRP